MTEAQILLRDYQREAISAVLGAASDQRLIVAMATGLGKTIVGAHLCALRPGRALWLVHRDELVDQTLEKLALVLPHERAGVVKAERDEGTARIVVASVQTLAQPRRLARLLTQMRDCGRFETIIPDEAHHAVALTWRRILLALGALRLDLAGISEAQAEAQARGRKLVDTLIMSRSAVADGPLVVGLTATPERGDGLALDAVFRRVVYRMPLVAGIVAGYLCDLRAIRVGLDLNLAGVTRNHGDFSEASLGAALMAQNVPEHIATAYQTHAAGRRAIVFVPLVEMGRRTVEALCERGVAAALVTANTPAAERRQLIANLRAGAVSAIVNCTVLTEGFDAPGVDCIIIGRPTRSRPLYTQMIGRGTRRDPGKSDCLILDLVGASDEHKIITLESLEGLDLRQHSVAEALAVIEAEAAQAERQIAVARKTRAANLFAALRWLTLVDGSYYLALPGGGVRLVPETGDAERVRAVRLERDGEHELCPPTRIDYAQGIVEDLIRRNGWLGLAQPVAPWHGQPATDPQRRLLRRIGAACADDPGLSRGDASRQISAWQAAQATGTAVVGD